MHEIQHVGNSHDITGLIETLSNAFDLNIDTQEVFTANDKLILKGYKGLAFIVRKSLKLQFSEIDLGLCLPVQLEAIRIALCSS